jgi:hypothetical protein
VVVASLVLLAALCALVACGSEPQSGVDLTRFKQMAREEADMADISNRLFVIDGELVFWQREGHVADAAYAYSLYGSTPERLLCRLFQTIAGPQKECNDEQYRQLFETITSNLDKPDLGLGPGHTVDPVSF